MIEPSFIDKQNRFTCLDYLHVQTISLLMLKKRWDIDGFDFVQSLAQALFDILHSVNTIRHRKHVHSIDSSETFGNAVESLNRLYQNWISGKIRTASVSRSPKRQTKLIWDAKPPIAKSQRVNSTRLTERTSANPDEQNTSALVKSFIDAFTLNTFSVSSANLNQW